MAQTHVTRTKISLTAIAVIGVLAAGSVLAAPLAANASPHTGSAQAAAAPVPEPSLPTTAAEVAAALATLAQANEKLSEQLNAAQAQSTLAQARVAAATHVVQRAQSDLTAAQRGLGSVLAQRYRSSTFSSAAALLASRSGESYLDSMQSLAQLSHRQADLAAAAARARAAADTAQQAADRALYASVQRGQALEQQRAALNAKTAKYESLLAMLTVTERTAYLSSNNATPAQIATALQNFTTGASPADIAAIKAALGQLGKPYIWAASGPDAFDCSGLTGWAWGKAGMPLPHLASAQQGMGTAIPLANLRPGDLVFFGSPAYHVALYLGSGMIVQAPNSGDVVKISPLASMHDYSGATRLG